MTAQPERTRKIRTNKVFTILENSTKRITSLRGGTRSGKTYNVLIWFVMKYLRETGNTLTIARETMPALKASAMRDFFEIIDVLGLYNEADHNRTRNEYTLNGNLIEFIAVSESDRVRGRKRTDLFINEVNEISLDSWRQLSFRTTRKIVIDYNPSEPEGFVYDDIESREDCDLFVTTYKDNPFLEDAIVLEIERLQDADEEYWKVYGLGELGSGAQKIFGHWRPGEVPQAGQKVYGLDFGYNNASALIEVTLYDNVLYWREMLYRSKLTNSDLITMLKTFPELNGRTIIADCAEPNRIEEISRAGFKIEPANKAVKDGIDFVKSHPLRIDTSGENLLREVKRYAWKLDKNQMPTDEPVKFDDHLMDAGRYASYSLATPEFRVTDRERNAFAGLSL
jgi:phage terminase large subunit